MLPKLKFAHKNRIGVLCDIFHKAAFVKYAVLCDSYTFKKHARNRFFMDGELFIWPTLRLLGTAARTRTPDPASICCLVSAQCQDLPLPRTPLQLWGAGWVAGVRRESEYRRPRDVER
jgi:hypothetical protein